MLNSDLFAVIAPNITINAAVTTHLVPQIECQLDEDVWGDKYDLGVVYLLAHTLTVAGRSGTGGAVTSESVGGLSRSYAAPDLNLDELGSTSFGIEFKRLRKQLVITPFVRC